MQSEKLKNIFNELNRENTRYCHWKSNIRLNMSITGESDLDILVDIKHKKKFIKILLKHKVIKFYAPHIKQYPDIENYIFMGGGLVHHFHIYYFTITGKHLLKDYKLPFTSLLLDDIKYYSKDFMIKIPNEESELIVFIIRIFIKSRFRHLLIKGISSEDKKELNFLIKHSDLKKVNNTLEKKDLDVLVDFIKDYRSKKIKNKDLIRIKLQILSIFKKNRRYNWFNSFFIFHFKRLLCIPFIIDRSRGKLKIKEKHIIFGFVGAHGSGKTTITKKIIKNWSDYVSIKRFYFGLPQNTFIEKITLLPFIFVNLIDKTLKKLNLYNNKITKMIDWWYNITISLRWLGIAISVNSLFKKMKRFSKKGYIIISDRFPLDQLNKLLNKPNEGPRIKGFIRGKPNSTILKLLKNEKIRYKKISKDNDVLKILFQVSLAESIRRGRPLSDTIKIRNEACNQIKKENKLIIINANNTINIVYKEVTDKMWDWINTV